MISWGKVTKLIPFSSGAVVTTTASTSPRLKFLDFSLRCDKSDPQISFETPWNWECAHGKKIAVISNNCFLRYQLVACMSGLASPVSGEILGNSVIGWPVGGEGGLDRKLRISHTVNFLTTVYSDCLEKSRVSLDQFWDLLLGVEINHDLTIKELTKEQKDFFRLALSVLFSFDCYLIPGSSYLMSKPAKPLRELLLNQLEGKTLFTTSTNVQFQREFCTDGLVLGSLGQILFAGPLADVLQWAHENLNDADVSESEDESFEMNLNLSNSEAVDDDLSDF